MCGIVAIFSPQRPVSATILDAATSSLSHRGPDGQSTWIEANARMGLGHTRLSIAAPDSAQPIGSEDGRRWLVANGEFYDFASTRRRLEVAGHRFRTDTDSEIALHLYEDLGAAALQHLRGEFAFVVWDGISGTVFAARDRFGIKPLFYAMVGDALILASEAKALFAAGLPATWDRESVYQQLFGCFHPGRSLFADVRQIPPGHYLHGTPQRHRLVRYWDVDYPKRGQEPAYREDECIIAVRELLDEAVRLRVQAHVPVGFLLSGGLDSSTVLSMAATHSDRPVSAFTIAFDDNAYDESAKARVAAEHVGADLQIVPLTEADVADHFAESVWHGETIQVNAHGTARFLLSRAIQTAGYRAVMAGEGADELFAGYGFVRPAIARNTSDGGIRRWPSRLLAVLRPLDDTGRQIAAVSSLLARVSRGIDVSDAQRSRIGEAISMLDQVLAADFKAEFSGRDPYWRFLRQFDWTGQVWGREPAKQILYLWLRSVFVNYHMAADRMDMAHAVEVRLPFLDHKLFEYASQIPVSLLAKDGRQKHILREAARPFVAEAIYHGAKQPFYAPPSTLKPENRLHELVQDTVRSNAMAALPFVDQHALIKLLDRAPTLDQTSQTMLDPLLMMLVSLYLLQERFALR